jgi:hypothetical protein
MAELSTAHRKKFEAQLSHAKKIMDAQVGKDGVIDTGPAYTHARSARDRALRMLGRKNPDEQAKTSPGTKKPSPKDPTGPEAVGGLLSRVKKLLPGHTTKQLEKVKKKAEGK